VSIDIVDLGVPLGKVQVRRGTKVIATVNVRNDSGGELKIRLKRLPPGLHKLKVFYRGSTATEPSKSKRLKLRVLRR
jgi:hypothetical protein